MRGAGVNGDRTLVVVDAVLEGEEGVKCEGVEVVRG